MFWTDSLPRAAAHTQKIWKNTKKTRKEKRRWEKCKREEELKGPKGFIELLNQLKVLIKTNWDRVNFLLSTQVTGELLFTLNPQKPAAGTECEQSPTANRPFVMRNKPNKSVLTWMDPCLIYCLCCWSWTLSHHALLYKLSLWTDCSSIASNTEKLLTLEEKHKSNQSLDLKFQVQ